MAGGISSSFSDDDGGDLSDINVTPLVDVVLVLLIVFMITVPVVVGAAARIQVDLPKSQYADQLNQPITMPLNLFLRREASGATQLYLEEQPVTIAELEAKVKKMGPPGNQVVSFSCDKDTPYSEVVRVIDELGRLGLHKLSLNTQHVEPKGK